MQILVAPTESSILTELTYLAADVAANAGTITVDNGQGLATDDYIVIERIGVETAELIKIATVTNQTITLSSNCSFVHKKGIRISKILYNQRRFYRATSKTGTYSLLSGGTKDIEVDRPDGTFFEDADGLSTSWYKATYYNETVPQETSLADCVPAKGNDSENYTSIYAIRKQAGFENAFGIKNETIFDYRDEAQSEFNSAIVSRYTIPLSSTPKIVRQIINLLAAGNLLIKEYGMEADIEISKSGARMIDRANTLIQRIVDGTLQLVDDDGALLGTSGNQLVSGSNVYTGASGDTGEAFNLGDEEFTFKDPANPRS